MVIFKINDDDDDDDAECSFEPFLFAFYGLHVNSNN